MVQGNQLLADVYLIRGECLAGELSAIEVYCECSVKRIHMAPQPYVLQTHNCMVPPRLALPA